MQLGAAVRRSLGPLEPWAAERYRRWFVDLDDLGRTLARLQPPVAILEIGCGEGAMGQRLVRAFPGATYLGVDAFAATPGRLYRGPAGGHAVFERRPVASLPRARTFDMVVLVDVLHHVPAPERPELLREGLDRLRSGGLLVVKDWERDRTVSHGICYMADRVVGGDSGVSFMSRDELLRLIPGTVVLEARVPPRRNNLLVVTRPT